MDDDVLRHGLEAVTVPGRLEVVHRARRSCSTGPTTRTAPAPPRPRWGRPSPSGSSCWWWPAWTTRTWPASWRLPGRRLPRGRDPGALAPGRVPRRTHARRGCAQVWAGTGVVVEVADDVAGRLDAALGRGRTRRRGARGRVAAHRRGARDRFLPLDDDLEDEVVHPPDDDDDDDPDLPTASTCWAGPSDRPPVRRFGVPRRLGQAPHPRPPHPHAHLESHHGHRTHPHPRQARRRRPRADRRGHRPHRAQGLPLEALELRTLERDDAEQHYGEHTDKPFFGSWSTFITSGPLVAMCVSGPDAIAGMRSLMGATNPIDAARVDPRGPGHRDRREHRARLRRRGLRRRELELFFPGRF
jgi:nucleoside-diphosphate kinase